MTYLFDTNALSDVMREVPTMDAKLRGLRQTDRVITCAVAWGELLFGIDRMPEGQKRRSFEAKVLGLEQQFPCEPIPAEAGPAYAKLKTALQRTGVTVGDNDLWIAAMTQLLGATLVSRDRDFLRIAGLSVEDWTK